MENSGVTVMVNVEKEKSNAAWICGLIGFITSIPNILCTFLCAGVRVAAAGLSAGLSADGSNFDETAADAAAADAASGAAGFFWVIVLVSIVCFALSFLGKSKNSLITGVIVLLGGILF